MRWSHEIVSTYDPNAVLPLDEVKAELDITHDDDDALIAAQRDAAINWVEDYTSRFMGPKVVNFVADRIAPSGIALPFAPVVSVASVNVGGEAVLAPISAPGASGTLQPPAGYRWPFYTQGHAAVRVSYSAGYAIGDCPPILTQAARIMTGVFYDRSDNPDRDMEAVKNMVRSYRYGMG